MTEDEALRSEVIRLAAAASEWELRYLRAKESCRAHQLGLRRTRQKLLKAQSELHLERASRNAEVGRLMTEVVSLRNKVERLSLKLISSWSAE